LFYVIDMVKSHIKIEGWIATLLREDR